MSTLGPLNGSPEAIASYRRPEQAPPSIGSLLALVCACGDISVDLLKSHRRSTRLMHLRSIVSVLSAEFHPRASAERIDEITHRGMGLTRWHRSRHADRMNLFPEYKLAYEYCREMYLRTYRSK